MTHHNVEIHHEEAEPESFWISVSAVITVLILLIAIIGSAFFFKATVSEEKTIKENTGTPFDLQKLRLYEDEQLHTLKWVEKDKKTVKITIDMAIQNVVSSYTPR